VRRRPVRLGHQGVRLRAGLLAVLVLLSLIAGRLVWLQGVQSSAYADQAVEQRLRTTTMLAARGTITARHGQPLALSVDARAVYGEPRTIAKARCPEGAERPCDPASIAEELAPVLGLDEAELRTKLSRPAVSTGRCTPADPMECSGFVYLARGLEPDVGTKVREMRLVGVGVMSEPKRVHPGGDLAANVVGFTALDDQGGTKGAGGIELAADGVLAGRDGRSQAEVDGGGRVIPNGVRTVQEPVAGRDVQLTLDRDLQWYAQDVLARRVAEADAESGTATVLDIQTGEVLALASVPTFDADDPGDAPAEVRGNRAVTDIFEPGSIGKVITVAAGLETGAVTPDTVLTVPDRYRMSSKVFKDSHDHPTERMTVTGVLVESSNVGTIQVAEKAGATAVHEMLGRFGLGQKSGLGLPGESRGLVPDPSQWSGPTLGALAIGQSYSVNAVQIASVYATIANDGVRVTPRIVKGTADQDGEVRPAAEPEQHRVVSAEIAAQLRGMLEGVTGEGGTAENASIPGYRVAGKTGTAQRVVDGRYNGYTASFVGFAPADAPRLVVAVSLQDPKNGYYGGVIAAPVFQDVMSYALSNQQVPPTGTPAPRLRLREGDPQ
jgi:cell division protein FtsI (penicillin-binding protein 3)